jgi:flagellar hook assembly protein FlgD
MTQDKPTPNRTVIRGDSDGFTIRFNNVTLNKVGIKLKTPIDITDYVIKLTVRKDIPKTTIVNDDDALISKIGIISNGETGEAYFDITSNDTDIDEGSYWYDIQYSINGTTKSLYKARYIIVGDITRSIG